MKQLIIAFVILFSLGTIQNIQAKESMTIEIIPLGEIDEFILDYLKENLGDVFSAEVYLGKSQAVPEYAFDKKRKQYFSSAILNNLANLRKEKDKIILAVIDEDLYIPQLNFVFGEASPVSGVCIISLIRLHQSYYDICENKDLFLKRSLKEAVHEIGHLLNLGHCPNPKCVMHFSNSLMDTDIKDFRFCSDCRRSLP